MNNQSLSFSIERKAFLGEQGELIEALPKDLCDETLVLEAYEAMVLGRNFDSKAIALQRTGQLGTYPSILGQEAIGAAIGLAMHEDDVFVPYYRDLITQYLRKVELDEVLLYWGGDERGSNYRRNSRDFPNCVPIATQLCHAAGAAVSQKMQGTHRAVVVTCGEGATSKGDFSESLNLVGAWQLPMVAVVNNNQWAISTPVGKQTHSQSIAQKAIAAGIPGIQVDGNDFFAVFWALKKALQRAYAGKGGTLIEAITYRLGDHTTADDATRYRSKEELSAAWEREPIKRLQSYLVARDLWDQNKEKALHKRCSDKIADAVKVYLNTSSMAPESMFTHLFESMPENLLEQYYQVKYAKTQASGEVL